jgi:hypothetical protein
MSAEDQERYAAACHAMQSGVAAEMTFNPGPTEPKHLRVGVNSALSGNGALAKLLIDKGVITLDELEAALADAMEEERDTYQARVSEAYGVAVTLE